MTVLELQTPVEASSSDRGVAALGRRGTDAAVLVSLLYWATSLTWGIGGRLPHRLSVAALLLAVALVATRPWRVLSPRLYALLCSVGVAAFAVTVTAPTGWRGADDAASYTYSAQLAAVVLAWAGTRERRQLLAGVVLLAVGLEFAQGWLGWWGGQDLSHPFVGTFYWHNQTGIFLAAGAVLGVTAVLSGLRGLRLLGWVIAPLSAAGVVLTTSRACEIAVAGAFVVLLLLSVVMAGRRLVRTLQVLVLGGLSVGMAVLLTSRAFFPHASQTGLGAAAAATRARAQGQDFSGNGVQRLDDWGRALAIFAHWPWSGAGFHSFRSAADLVGARHDHVLTAFAHSGYLQVLSDGGLLLAVPVLAALTVGAWWVARSLVDAWRSGDVLRLGAGLVLVVLALHSGMDFDWSYPSLLALFVLVLVLCGRPLAVRPVPPRAGRLLLAGLGLGLLVLSALGAWGGDLHLNVAVAGT